MIQNSSQTSSQNQKNYKILRHLNRAIINSEKKDNDGRLYRKLFTNQDGKQITEQTEKIQFLKKTRLFQKTLIISHLAKGLNDLHKQHITHGAVNLDNIYKFKQKFLEHIIPQNSQLKAQYEIYKESFVYTLNIDKKKWQKHSVQVGGVMDNHFYEQLRKDYQMFKILVLNIMYNKCIDLDKDIKEEDLNIVSIGYYLQKQVVDFIENQIFNDEDEENKSIKSMKDYEWLLNNKIPQQTLDYIEHLFIQIHYSFKSKQILKLLSEDPNYKKKSQRVKDMMRTQNEFIKKFQQSLKLAIEQKKKSKAGDKQ